MPARQCTQPTSESVIYDLLIMYHSRKFPYLSHGWLMEILRGRGVKYKRPSVGWGYGYFWNDTMAELNNNFLTLFRVLKNHFIASLSNTHFISKPSFPVFSYKFYVLEILLVHVMMAGSSL